MLTDQIADFLLRKRRKAAPTYEQYRFVLERVLQPWCQQVGITEAAQLDDTAMMKLTDHLSARKLSAASVQTYVRSVRIFLTWAKVPAGDYEPVHVPRRMRDTLSRVEIDRMEAAAKNERDKLIIRVLADTGIRVGELIGLRPQDFRADTHARWYFIRVTGKGDRQREVGLPAETYRRLRHFATNQADYIFNRNGQQLARSSVEYVIRKLAKDAKIGRRVWPHLFRASFVTEMARRGVPVQDVMKSVGHTTPAMTMVIYNHTTAGDSYDRIMAALK
jgi:site-specific recombinase XerD